MICIFILFLFYVVPTDRFPRFLVDGAVGRSPVRNELESGLSGSKVLGRDPGVEGFVGWGGKIEGEERVEERASRFSRSHLLPRFDLAFI